MNVRPMIVTESSRVDAAAPGGRKPFRPRRRVLAELAESIRPGDGGEAAGGEDQGGGRGGVGEAI